MSVVVLPTREFSYTRWELRFKITFIQVAFTNAKRAQRYDDDIPIHIDRIPHHDRDELQREFGTEVLIDILLLAKSDEFLHTESSVAALASYYNPHMKSYFLGDMIGGTCEVREWRSSILCIIHFFIDDR